MTKFYFFIIMVFLGIISLLAILNKGTVDLRVWKCVVLDEIPVFALVIISTAVGILSMFIIVVIRDARK